jgi:hypothetical protein
LRASIKGRINTQAHAGHRRRWLRRFAPAHRPENAFSAATVIALDDLRRRGFELNLDRLRTAGVQEVHGDFRCPEDLIRPPGLDFIAE